MKRNYSLLLIILLAAVFLTAPYANTINAFASTTLAASSPTGGLLAAFCPTITLKKSWKRQSQKAVSREVLAYTAIDYPGDDRSFQSISQKDTALNAIATFTYQLDKNGGLNGEAPLGEIRLAKRKDIQSLALIHNFSGDNFNADLISTVLKDEKKRSKLVSNILTVLKNNGYHGVNIDFENVPPPFRENYSHFLQELKKALSSHGYLLTVSIPAKTQENLESSWSGAFDYQAIGRYADRVQIMTYDEHWFGGPPGPVASIGWVENVVRYAVKTIPHDKILLGVASYGYDWAEDGTCRAVTARNAVQMAKRQKKTIHWDKASASPYFQYTDSNNVHHTVWYESSKSASYKLMLVKKYNLKGIGIWRLGFEEPSLWKEIKTILYR